MVSSQDEPVDETALCRLLAWDSEFFGKRIARAYTERINEDLLREITDWCAENRIDCLYLLAASNDPATISYLRRQQLSRLWGGETIWR